MVMRTSLISSGSSLMLFWYAHCSLNFTVTDKSNFKTKWANCQRVPFILFEVTSLSQPSVVHTRETLKPI